MNHGFFYNKKYFAGLDYDYIVNAGNKERTKKVMMAENMKTIKARNEEFLQSTIADQELALMNTFFSAGNHSIELTCSYPGLVTGIGVEHEMSIEGEFKLGFNFDYTTGLPIIPGSSVKGLLRSCFPNETKGDKSNLPTEIRRSNAALVSMLLQDIDPYDKNASTFDWERSRYDYEAIKLIEEVIFDGKRLDHSQIKEEHAKYSSMTGRDKFLDAFIIATNNSKIFGSDYITPHKNDPFKDPIPLPFIKVLPGVTFRFNFSLQSTPGLITEEQKKNLFEKLLIFKGIGAKTNVGYGQLMNFVEYKRKKEKKKEAPVSGQKQKEKVKIEKPLNAKNYSNLNPGDAVNCRVKEIDWNARSMKLEITFDDKEINLNITPQSIFNYSEGQIVSFTIRKKEGDKISLVL